MSIIDSTAAIEQVRTDALGPAQRFVGAAIELCDPILARGVQVTIRWVPSHFKIEGNVPATDTPRQRRIGRHHVGTRPPGELLDEAPLRT